LLRGTLTEIEFFYFADQPLDVAHAEELLDERLRLEGLEVVDVLARADEDH
jgi:hypothetical protein